MFKTKGCDPINVVEGRERSRIEGDYVSIRPPPAHCPVQCSGLAPLSALRSSGVTHVSSYASSHYFSCEPSLSFPPSSAFLSTAFLSSAYHSSKKTYSVTQLGHLFQTPPRQPPVPAPSRPSRQPAAMLGGLGARVVTRANFVASFMRKRISNPNVVVHTAYLFASASM